MTTQFIKDLEAAKAAERIVYEYLSTSGYEVENISFLPEYYHKGDIKVITPSGIRFIDVKDDSRIHQTGNILAEDWVQWKYGNLQAGFMHNSYDIIAIVSKAERKIYFIDFCTLKGMYKKFELKEIEHPAQITYGYLVPLCNVKAHGGLLGTVCY